ncbi:hypothetical protein ACKI16_29435 [Streptomyces scabiei]|uniref:hypothetical protein n=1 Tax=Streptomyces scabiei TaxID=1930 RepID=UPI0038F5FEE7
MTTIRVQPAAARRKAFAVWATAQTPKVKTVAPNTFSVPASLFVDAPEEILIGSLIDGQRFVSPAEDAATGTPPPGAPVLPEREAVPGEPLPELPESAYGPDAVPLPPPDFAPLDDAPTGDEDQEQAEGSDSSDPAPEEAPAGPPYACGLCGRDYSTTHGLATHRGQKHPEGA